MILNTINKQFQRIKFREERVKRDERILGAGTRSARPLDSLLINFRTAKNEELICLL